VRPIHLTFSLVKTSEPNKQRNEGYEYSTEVCFETDKIRDSQYISIIKSCYFPETMNDLDKEYLNKTIFL
jgi:hypothetical protein